MNVDLLRKREGERRAAVTGHGASSSSALLHVHLGRLRRAMARPRTRAGKIRLLLLLGALTFFFCTLIAILVHLYPNLFFGKSETLDEWVRRRVVCPTDTLIDLPPLRPKPVFLGESKADPQNDRTPAFAFEVSDQNAIPGFPTTVAGLDRFCAARVSEVPRWAAGSWRQWTAAFPHEPGVASTSRNGAMFNLTIAPNFLANATYTAMGSPFCLSGGALYLTQQRIDAGGAAVFEKEGRLNVLPLTDRVLQRAVLSNASAGLHVVPAMGLVLSGFWIATHFFHLITDALETLYGAFHTMENGVLMDIPTQTVMVHSSATNWIDRRGDRSRKMEFSAALGNAFSSPLLKNGSPYNTSFMFRPDSKYCIGREDESKRVNVGPGPAASEVCFCDGLLVTTHNHPFMDSRIYYGVQDWASRAFRAPPYVERRSVHEMERLRIAQSPPWAARFWPEAAHTADPLSQPPFATDTAAAPTTLPYRPRVLFVHRTTRLIANATQYAAWMREIGFRVEEVYLEQLTAAQQYHLGRYADVVVGMHGLGIGHAMWMEREPHGCRTVIEFRPWVIQSMPVQPLRVLGQTMKFHFMMILPTDVHFGHSVKFPERERELLLSIERINSAFSFSSFTDQTVYFDDAEVRRVFWAVRQHLNRCLPK